MAQSLYRVLQRQYKNLDLQVLAPKWSQGILAKMPEVNKVHIMPLGHGQLQLKIRFDIGVRLRSENFQRAIVLPNSLKSALIPFFAGIPRRSGWRGEFRYGLLNDIRILDKKQLPFMVERFVALERGDKIKLKHCPMPRLRVAKEDSERALEKFHLNLKRPVLALCPGAEYGPAKRWPPAYFSELADVMSSRGWQIWKR